MLLKSGILFFVTNLLVSSKSETTEYLEFLEEFQTLEILKDLSESNGTCGDDLSKYLNGLQNFEMWALKMLDSSAKIPEGIFKGNSMFLGQYDECLEVEHPNQTFTGQYCTFQVDIHIPLGHQTVKMVRLDQVTLAQEFTISFSSGICLPSTCSESELKEFLNAKNSSIFSISLAEGSCNTNEKKPIKDSDWVVFGILIAFGVIALLSTIYDVFKRCYQKNEKPHALLSSFSFYTNCQQLFRISEASSQLQCLHGMRFFSMCWVVLGHTFAMSISGPVVNFFDIPKLLTDVNYTVIINSYVSVDSFFFLSGLLVCFVFFRDISKKKYYDVPLSYLHRYIRLTPPFGFMMLIQATIYTYLGDGPLWNGTSEGSAEPCRKDWWSGILYVQNFVAPYSSCLGQSWYLSVDMQMFWIAPLVLYPMLFWPIFAPIYLVLLILVVAFANFAIGYVYDLGPSAGLTNNMDQWTIDYTRFYVRAVPYLIGIALAYIICGIQAKKIKIQLTPLWAMIGWVVAAGLCLGALYGIVPFSSDHDWTTLEAAFYLAFHRVMWALGLAWIVFACVQGYGGPINTFLSWGVFQPLGKLSYCAFLMHISIQMYRLGTLRTNIYLGNLEMTYYFLGDLVLANLLSIPFTLLFEMPFGNIDRYLFQNVKILPYPRPKKMLETKQSSKEVNNNNDRLNEVIAERGNRDRRFD